MKYALHLQTSSTDAVKPGRSERLIQCCQGVSAVISAGFMSTHHYCNIVCSTFAPSA